MGGPEGTGRAAGFPPKGGLGPETLEWRGDCSAGSVPTVSLLLEGRPSVRGGNPSTVVMWGDVGCEVGFERGVIKFMIITDHLRLSTFLVALPGYAPIALM